MLIAALTAAAAALLAVAGLAKLRTPGPAATMIAGFWPRLAPLRRARSVARAVGIVETATGTAILVAGGRIAATALAACYLALTLVALRLVFGGRRAPCGCFGAADGDVGVPHVLLDGCALAIAVAAIITAPAGVGALFASGALIGSVASVQAALLAALGYLSITALPALVAARKPLERS